MYASSATGTCPLADDETTVVGGNITGNEGTVGIRRNEAFSEHLKPNQKTSVSVYLPILAILIFCNVQLKLPQIAN